MSFVGCKRVIEEGDTVIICRGRDRLIPAVVKRGVVIQVKGGAVTHDSLVGVEYGSKVYTSNKKGWVLVLHPTPELWTVSLPHRTQIIYSTDISIITMQLELRPGSVVCECGTGSASLSHAIARTIAPSGHLYTFEFHEQRAKLAGDEFIAHGLNDLVTVQCRDVCVDGFGLVGMADAVFLDLPNPWEAIESGKMALKLRGGRICSFSPCMEQVQRTCEKLRSSGFVDVEVMECLQRPFDVRPCSISIPNLGFTGEQHCLDKIESGNDDNEERMQFADSEEICQSEKSGSEDKICAADVYQRDRTVWKKPDNPILTSTSLYTCAQHRTIPGHTGFLTFASLFSRPRLVVTN